MTDKEDQTLMQECEHYITRREKVKHGDVFECELGEEDDIPVIKIKYWFMKGDGLLSRDMSFDVRHLPKLIEALEKIRTQQSP